MKLLDHQVCPTDAASRQRIVRRLSLAEPVAKAVRRNDVEYLPRNPVAFFDVELREFLV
jgi:hypothetical protein